MKNEFRLKSTRYTKLHYHPYSKINIRTFYDKIGVFCIELLSPIVEGVIWYDQNDCTYYYRTMIEPQNDKNITWFLEAFTYCTRDEIESILQHPNTNIEVYYKGGNSYV